MTLAIAASPYRYSWVNGGKNGGKTNKLGQYPARFVSSNISWVSGSFFNRYLNLREMPSKISITHSSGSMK